MLEPAPITAADTPSFLSVQRAIRRGKTFLLSTLTSSPSDRPLYVAQYLVM